MNWNEIPPNSVDSYTAKIWWIAFLFFVFFQMFNQDTLREYYGKVRLTTDPGFKNALKRSNYLFHNAIWLTIYIGKQIRIQPLKKNRVWIRDSAKVQHLRINPWLDPWLCQDPTLENKPVSGSATQPGSNTWEKPCLDPWLCQDPILEKKNHPWIREYARGQPLRINPWLDPWLFRQLGKFDWISPESIRQGISRV